MPGSKAMNSTYSNCSSISEIPNPYNKQNNSNNELNIFRMLCIKVTALMKYLKNTIIKVLNLKRTNDSFLETSDNLLTTVAKLNDDMEYPNIREVNLVKCAHNTHIYKNRAQTSSNSYLLPPPCSLFIDRKCLIVDLDETLIHSSYLPIKNPDFILEIDSDNLNQKIYVKKRPFLDDFLLKIGSLFECILFTASLKKYANMVVDKIDINHVFVGRLFRESCSFNNGIYIKDLDKLGRNLDQTIIMDNSPFSYYFHPKNSLPVPSWYYDSSDTFLWNLIPICDELFNSDDLLFDLQIIRHRMIEEKLISLNEITNELIVI